MNHNPRKLAPLPPNDPESGSVLITTLIAVMLVGGVAAMMLHRSHREQQATQLRLQRAQALVAAETGLQYNYPLLAADPVYAVKNTTGFAWDATTQQYVGAPATLTATAGGKAHTFQYGLQYRNGNTPVQFATRSSPTESYDRIRVTCTSGTGLARRTVVATYAFQMGQQFQGGIISDMNPTGTGSGKSGAQKGNITFDGGPNQHYVFGDIRANGDIRYENTSLTDQNASANFTVFHGKIEKNLRLTADPIPDFTSLGGPDQLFDFAQFEAAANAGAGQVYTTLAAFRTAMNAANAQGKTLEGITVLKIDPAVEGNGPKLTTSNLAGGINITGTLVFRFKSGTAADYKVFIETPLNINKANLTGWNKSVESTYTSGYPGTYTNPAKKPSAVNIAPTYKNFAPDADLPALMFNNGIVDIHDAANICGVIYGPSFIEIEMKDSNKVQYINGSIFGGGGIYFQGKSGSTQAIRYDPNTVDKLTTMQNKAQVLTRIGYSVEQ